MTKFEIMQAAREHAPEIKWEYEMDGLVISKMMPCKSAAGWYPGRMCFDSDVGFIEPYNRFKEYGYFRTEKEVQGIIDDLVF